jgi:ABC-type dipeptide/oligopeptide/nickel transport system permease component
MIARSPRTEADATSTQMLRYIARRIAWAVFVVLAVTMGMSQWRLLRSHVLRNALMPIVTMLGMDLGLAIGSSIYIERVFRLPGLGSLVFSSLIGAQGYELPVIAGVVLVASIAVVTFKALVDLAYGFVDPRVRVG